MKKLAVTLGFLTFSQSTKAHAFNQTDDSLAEFTTSTTWPETSMLAMGRKKKQKKNKTTPQPIDPDLEDPNILRLFGDEKSPRGTHRCGNVHIPPITCPSGDCPDGYPRYKRPCQGPPLRGKFKCRVECGNGFKVENGSPKKMKCLGKQGTPGQWKVRPKTFGHVIECVPKKDSKKKKN